MSEAKSMHSEPMKAQMAIFLLSSPVDVGGVLAMRIVVRARRAAAA